MPALCRPVIEGGVGFDYRLSMAVPGELSQLCARPFRSQQMPIQRLILLPYPMSFRVPRSALKTCGSSCSRSTRTNSGIWATSASRSPTAAMAKSRSRMPNRMTRHSSVTRCVDERRSFLPFLPPTDCLACYPFVIRDLRLERQTPNAECLQTLAFWLMDKEMYTK